MSSFIDTQVVKSAADALERARSALAKANADYKAVKSLNGQVGYEVSVSGVRIDVAVMDSQTYIAKMIRGREMIHLGALKALQARIDDCKVTVVARERSLHAAIGSQS
jgi:hypothetical protein